MSKYANKGWREIYSRHYIKEIEIGRVEWVISVYHICNNDWILTVVDFDDFESQIINASEVSEIKNMAEKLVVLFLEEKRDALNKLMELVKGKEK